LDRKLTLPFEAARPGHLAQPCGGNATARLERCIDDLALQRAEVPQRKHAAQQLPHGGVLCGGGWEAAGAGNMSHLSAQKTRPGKSREVPAGLPSRNHAQIPQPDT